jgi:hypothetical protein
MNETLAYGEVIEDEAALCSSCLTPAANRARPEGRPKDSWM